jgi:hypothetical protein
MPLALSCRIQTNKGLISTLLVLAFLVVTHSADGQTDPSQQTVVLAEEQDYAFAIGLYKDGVYQLAEEQLARFLRRYPSSLKKPKLPSCKANASSIRRSTNRPLKDSLDLRKIFLNPAWLPTPFSG